MVSGINSKSAAATTTSTESYALVPWHQSKKTSSPIPSDPNLRLIEIARTLNTPPPVENPWVKFAKTTVPNYTKNKVCQIATFLFNSINGWISRCRQKPHRPLVKIQPSPANFFETPYQTGRSQDEPTVSSPSTALIVIKEEPVSQLVEVPAPLQGADPKKFNEPKMQHPVGSPTVKLIPSSSSPSSPKALLGPVKEDIEFGSNFTAELKGVVKSLWPKVIEGMSPEHCLQFLQAWPALAQNDPTYVIAILNFLTRFSASERLSALEIVSKIPKDFYENLEVILVELPAPLALAHAQAISQLTQNLTREWQKVVVDCLVRTFTENTTEEFGDVLKIFPLIMTKEFVAESPKDDILWKFFDLYFLGFEHEKDRNEAIACFEHIPSEYRREVIGLILEIFEGQPDQYLSLLKKLSASDKKTFVFSLTDIFYDDNWVKQQKEIDTMKYLDGTSETELKLSLSYSPNHPIDPNKDASNIAPSLLYLAKIDTDRLQLLINLFQSFEDKSCFGCAQMTYDVLRSLSGHDDDFYSNLRTLSASFPLGIYYIMVLHLLPANIRKDRLKEACKFVEPITSKQAGRDLVGCLTAYKPEERILIMATAIALAAKPAKIDENTPTEDERISPVRRISSREDEHNSAVGCLPPAEDSSPPSSPTMRCLTSS